MKKIVSLFVFTLCSAWVMGQIIMPIGNPNSGNDQGPPFEMDLAYVRSASIYLHNEIGTSSGLIIQLGWDVVTSDFNSCPAKIYLKLTSSTSFTSGSTWTSMISGAALVYDGPVSFATSGWQTIDIADFVYSTTSSNLLVLCETDFGINVASSTPTFRFTPGSLLLKQHEFWWGPSPPTGYGFPNVNRPNIQITYYTPLSSVIPPSGFMAVAQSPSQINLNWTKNSFPDNVMVAFSTGTTFGTPSGTYIPGDTITGGGTVIYNGSGITFSQVSGLSPNTTYYYQAWSFHSSNSTYSSGASSSATTFCENITWYPYITDFESAAFPPSCWTSASIPWARFDSANGSGTGYASAKADFFDIYPGNFDLISPQLDLSSVPDPVIRFDYAYAYDTTSGFSIVDSLELWYSTNNGASYTLLTSWMGGLNGPLNTGGAMTTPFVPDSAQWRTIQVSLPSATNKVKLRGVSYLGNNLYLDNITFGEIEYTWNGINSENWNNPLNWTPNIVPSEFQDIAIPSGTPHNPKISNTGLACNQLTVKHGATLTLNAGSGLTVKANLIIQNGATLTNKGVIILKGNLINLN